MKSLIILLIAFQVQAETTYEKDAKPIFKNRCSLCHDSLVDKDWRDYNIAYAKRDLILKRVWDLKDMPQGNATNMTDKEREIIRDWIKDGAKK